MTTDGIEGFLVETRNYGATAAFWKSLGFENVLETDHGSGHWSHPAGGPYVFIVEQHERELATHPVLKVADAEAFAPDRAPEFAQQFTPTHWGVQQALVRDPDGRIVALESPLRDRSDSNKSNKSNDGNDGTEGHRHG
ncbi:VOC family protein [Streptomyces aureoversilis]|uniref:VOC family protein n=1 Tax=Streptomyces aureoversilis TaxID=67277 RepID=A0ABV9ZTL4_9ACTN